MKRNTQRWITLGAALVVLCVGAVATAGHPEKGVDARAAFDKLKGMAGTWHGQAAQEGDHGEEHAEHAEGAEPMAVTHEFEVSANGTVVMETMNPGTEHEMINMYHLDGDELVLTHYCAGGNQPTMRLDREKAKSNEMPFEFTGGTNLDPAKDHHIHDARLVVVDDDHVESYWTGYSDGKAAGTMKFVLERAE